MAQTFAPYSTGTVTATNGSTTVTGSGTTWTDLNASAGSIITIAGIDYTILTRDSATQVTLTANYAETTGSGKAYKVATIKNPTALTAAETITVNSGATLWITNGTYTGTGGAGTITVNDGLLKITNSSTSTGFKFLLAASTTTWTVQTRGLEITGNWISIGTGNGNASQTATHWDATGEFVPCVWVETGSGTGVYEKYLNLSGIAATHTIDMTRIGAGKYGKFFTQSGATLTFGNGTNGKCPPNGANIRVPNIILSYFAVLSTTFPTITHSIGDLRIDTCQMSRIKFGGANGNRTVRVYRSGVLGYQTWGHAYDTLIEDTGFAHNSTDAAWILKSNHPSAPMRDWVFNNVSGWNYSNSSANAMFLFQTTSITFTDCEFYALHSAPNTSGTGILATADSNCSVKIVRGIYAGMWSATGVHYVEGAELIDTPRMSKDSTNISRALVNISGTVDPLTLKDVTVPAGGACYAFFNNGSGTVNNVSITGLKIQASDFSYVFNSGSSTFGKNWYIRDCDTATGNWFAASASYFKVYNSTFQNIRCSGSAPNILSGLQTGFQNTILRGIAVTNVPNSSTSGTNYDMFWYTVNPTPSTSAVGLCFAIATANTSNYITLTGTAQLTGQQINLPNTGDTAIFECPYKIFGVSSLGATVQGGLPASVTIEYSIKKTGDWSAWATANTTNLAAETVSATDGFNFKLRFTATSDSASANKLVSWYTTGNGNDAVLYASSTATLTLTGLQNNSEVRIYDHTTGTELGGIENSGTSFAFTYDYYGNQTVDIVVLALNYQWVKIPYTLTATSATVPVQQIFDRQYNNP